MPRGFSLTGGAGHWADGRHGRAARVAQAAVERDEQLARARMVPVLAQPDALPCAQVQLALRYRDSERAAEKARLHVRRHVVGALARVPVRQPLRHYLVQHHLHVVPHVRVPALVQRQRRARVQYYNNNNNNNINCQLEATRCGWPTAINTLTHRARATLTYTHSARGTALSRTAPTRGSAAGSPRTRGEPLCAAAEG